MAIFPEFLKRVTGKIRINKSLQCLTLTEGQIDMKEEKPKVTNRYQLISPSGARLGIYDSALEAASAAGGFWPGVGQKDDEHEGWDIEAVQPK